MPGNGPRSPLISQISWGEMNVETLGTGRDFKLFPGGGRAWDWNETGTHHRPGVQIADLVELLDHGSEIIVLSRGMQCMLHTCADVFTHLHAKNLSVCVAETRAAVDLYNSLATSGRKVGGLFHSTC